MVSTDLGRRGFRLGEQDIAACEAITLKKLGCHAILQSRNNVFKELTSQFFCIPPSSRSPYYER